MRELVIGTLQFKGQPKENPFKEGEMQVGLKFSFGENGEAIEEWINVKPDVDWIKPLEKGDAFTFVKEWSVKKKAKDGSEGAYAYRPIKTVIPLNKPAKQPTDQHPKPSPEKSKTRIGEVLKFYLFLKRQLGGKAPMRILLEKLKSDQLINDKQYKWCGERFLDMGHIIYHINELEGETRHG